jgi:hypothetical protein
MRSVVGSIPAPVRMFSPEESSGLRNGILHRNLPRRRRNPELTMNQKYRTSIFFPSRKAFILRHPVCAAESGFDFCISVYRQTPTFRHPFFRKQCFSLKYVLGTPPLVSKLPPLCQTPTHRRIY